MKVLFFDFGKPPNYCFRFFMLVISIIFYSIDLDVEIQVVTDNLSTTGTDQIIVISECSNPAVFQQFDFTNIYKAPCIIVEDAESQNFNLIMPDMERGSFRR